GGGPRRGRLVACDLAAELVERRPDLRLWDASERPPDGSGAALAGGLDAGEVGADVRAPPRRASPSVVADTRGGPGQSAQLITRPRPTTTDARTHRSRRSWRPLGIEGRQPDRAALAHLA